MIVVVIIGILASVAIPSYKGFQDKAKGSEAKVGLGGIYAAEKAYFAEHSKYKTEFASIGVDLGTTKYYNIGFIAVDSCIKKGLPDVVTCTTATHLPTTAVALDTTFVAGAGRWKTAETLETKKSFTINNNRVILDKL